jgi:cobalt-zinc-cadmium efflux system membrane fusion protein
MSSTESRVTIQRRTAYLLAFALLVGGAAGALVIARVAREQIATGRLRAAPTSESTATGRLEVAPAPATDPHAHGASTQDGGDDTSREVVFPVSPEAASRAGMRVEPVTIVTATDTVRIPGVIEPNSYRQVEVTSLTPGRVTRVAVELGQSVRKGQTLAEVFSSELADAQTRYVGARAELGAHERELQRTQRLVEIGAASRQDLERIHAEHTAQKTVVQTARSRLTLLGMREAAIDALVPGERVDPSIAIASPRAGVITQREANPGLNIDTTTKLFTVVDMTTVWVVGDVYERDFGRVNVGDRATVTITAYPALTLSGRVSYIDPQLNRDTRTGRVRVEVPNPELALKLGMYAEIAMGGRTAREFPVVPARSVQNVGSGEVVYVVDSRDRGKLTERPVRLGTRSADRVEVVEGLQPGELVVTDGSFFARAERERLGLQPAAAAPPAATRVKATERGFEPAKVRVKAGVPVRLTFIRTTEATCATEVVFPSLKIRRPLPLNKPVVVELTPGKTGEIAFACGMDMFKGAVVAE